MRKSPSVSILSGGGPLARRVRGDPDYQKVLPYKLAALKAVLMPMHDELVVPDLRWPVAALLLAVPRGAP